MIFASVKLPASTPSGGALRGRWGRAPALASALLLAACATTPEPKIRTVEVKVPVPVNCTTDPGPDPIYADGPDSLRAAADIFARVQLLLAGRAQRDARLAELKASTAGCRS